MVVIKNVYYLIADLFSTLNLYPITTAKLNILEGRKPSTKTPNRQVNVGG
jgi:hypothetical protein